MRTFKQSLVAGLTLVLLAAAATPLSNPSPSPMQQLFMLKELKPDAKRVGILWRKDAKSQDKLMPKIKRAAAATQLKLFVSHVESMKDVGPQFRDLVRSNEIDVLWIVENDGVVDTRIAKSFLIKNATKKGIPIMAPTPDWVTDGAAFALKEGSEGIEFVVNQSVADATSLTIPEKYVEQTEFLTMN